MCDSNNTAVVGICTHPIVVYIYLITYVLIVSIVMLNLFTGGACPHCLTGSWLPACLDGAGRVLVRPAGHNDTTSIHASSTYLTPATALTSPLLPAPCSRHHREL